MDRQTQPHIARRAARSFSCSLVAAVALLACVGTACAADNDASWPEWQRFKQLYVSNDGRVIDASVPESITTSEGQSYALFFALVANDRDAFARVLAWTQNNLAGGDLRRALPAWQWGRDRDGSWRTLDLNSASDSDVWIAYALGEAGRLWCNASYSELGRAVAARILREEVAFLPGLGSMLLPGPKGFVEGETWRLNASYVPLQVLRGLGKQTGARLWDDVLKSSQRVILASAPRGAVADWIQYHPRQGFIVDRTTRGVGSYNAIRVYLWTGSLSQADGARARLARQLAPLVVLVSQRAAPPEEIDTATLAVKGEGSPGFSAAFLPLLADAKDKAALEAHRARAATDAFKDNRAYYSDVLALFGLGWLEGRYRFEASGLASFTWKQSCRSGQ